MAKNWIGTFVLVGMSMAAGLFLAQKWELVLGQPVGFTTGAPQVVVQQQSELPKWCVNFVTLPLLGENGPRIQMITVVDTEAKKIAVYRMELTTGYVWLLSVRDIQPDLMIQQFNAKEPLPAEIMQDWQQQRGTSKKNTSDTRG